MQPELGKFSSLQWLPLTSKQLTGSVPPELGKLSSLQWLPLTSNQLTGSVPLELGKFGSLSALRLLTNQLTGSLPPELGNQFLTGSSPAAIGDLSELRSKDPSKRGLMDMSWHVNLLVKVGSKLMTQERELVYTAKALEGGTVGIYIGRERAACVVVVAS